MSFLTGVQVEQYFGTEESESLVVSGLESDVTEEVQHFLQETYGMDAGEVQELFDSYSRVVGEDVDVDHWSRFESPEEIASAVLNTVDGVGGT